MDGDYSLIRRAAALAQSLPWLSHHSLGFYLFRYLRPPGHEMSDSISAYIQDAIRNGGVHSVPLSGDSAVDLAVAGTSYLYGMANVTTAPSGGRQTFPRAISIPQGNGSTFRLCS